MAIGFRKSLFGFNSSDVLEYIETTHKTFVKKENELKAKADALKEDLNLCEKKYSELEFEKQEIEKKLAEFNAKYEDIERLSENIGKLYLVAQANAKAIIENSENSAKIAKEEVDHNLYTISNAHDSLKELRKSIMKTSEDFVAEVDGLISSLNITREKIADNNDSVLEAEEQFSNVYAEIVG